MLARLSKPVSALASTLILSSCLHLQLGGGIASATLTVTPLRDPTQILQQVESPSQQDLLEAFPEGNWDQAGDALKLLLLGNVALNESLFSDDELYLVTAAGGIDYDANGNREIDAMPVVVGGQWHAILSGEQLTKGQVTALTEVVYRSLELDLEALNDALVIAAMDAAAERLVPDLDQSGDVDYQDVLVWNRQYSATSLLASLAQVDELIGAVSDAASAATLRELSLDILGQPAVEGSLFEISGQVSVTSSTRVDGDVNDVQANFHSNDSIDNAQKIINPVVLGGYVNQAGAGEPGASFSNGDTVDFFRADLLAGQRITLVMADAPAVNDIDLYLYDTLGNLIDASLGLSELEQLTVPVDGTYAIAVEAFSGASNYRLALGLGDLAPATAANTEQLRLSDDFVPGEIIARFHPRHSAVNTMEKRARFTGMRARGGLRRANLLRLPPQHSTGNARQLRKLRTLLALKKMRRQQEVSSADLNFYVRASAIPNDTYYYQQSWHYEMINLPAAWNLSQGDEVVVAVVDTGVLLDHPDLEGQLIAGYDFISSTSIAVDGDGIDDDPNDPGDSTGPTRSSFHGTHVAGTIAASSNNVRGVSGIAWNARIMPLRALGAGGGTTYDVLQAVRYAAGLSNDSGRLPQQSADIINLSLSGGGFSASAQALYSEVAARGVIVVAAAGNENSSAFAYPASYNDVISVSAVNIRRERASYSNFGSRIDVAAPGGDGLTRDVNGDGIADLILSTSGDDSESAVRNTYQLLQGTSMAAPHVAGVIALMKAVDPALDSTSLRNALQQGLLTEDLGSAGRDNIYGHGLINANKAVLAAQAMASGEDIRDLPALSVSVAALNYGTLATRLPLVISNGGTGLLQVDAVDSADSWLTIEPAEVDGNGLGSYFVNLDRSQLAIGSYRSSITVSSNAGTTTLQVILQQADPSIADSGDAGLLYILLVNAKNGEVEGEASAYPQAGKYLYSFREVPAGDYQIYAGADADNDFFICDAGEACGAWPVLHSQPAIIQLRQDLSGMNFSATFNTGIISASGPGDKRRGWRRPGH
jgi:serine protease